MNKKIILIYLGFIIYFPANANLLRVGFDDAMFPAGTYEQAYVNYNPFWRLVKSLYTEQIVNNLQYSPTPLIPRIIHQVWLGSKFPEKYKAWQATWIKAHPDWEYKLWTDKDVEKLKLVNKKMYDKASNYGEKSDIARVEILYRFGGLYIDTDFECLKPFDDLHHCCNFYAGIDSSPTAAYNGLIASAPHHPLLKYYIKNMQRASDANDSADDIKARTGPRYFTKILNEFLHQYPDGVVIFPTTFFYPWPTYARFENSPEQIARWVRPESMAIHHWEVSWNNGDGGK